MRALLLALALLPQDAPRERSAALEARRERILATARSYAELRWTAGEGNRLHGLDADGVRVDTPDAGHLEGGWRAGEAFVGVPYAWGGFSTPEEFLAGVAAGRPAGHVPHEETTPPSRFAVGVDCSGFVSRCWDLPVKQSTRSLGRLCYAIGWDELLPGDLLNSFDGHAVLFLAFEGEEALRVLEAGFPCVKETVYALADARALGLVPQRYAPLDARFPVVAPGPESVVLTEPGTFVPSEAGSELPPAPHVASPPGAWLRYLDAGGRTLTRHAAGARDGTVTEVVELALEGRAAQWVETTRSDVGWLERLLALTSEGQPLVDARELARRVTRGAWRAGERAWPAHRLELELAAAAVVRGERYELAIALTAIVVEGAPLGGVVHVAGTVRMAGETEGREKELRALAWSDG